MNMKNYILRSEHLALIDREREKYEMLQEGMTVLQEELTEAHAQISDALKLADETGFRETLSAESGLRIKAESASANAAELLRSAQADLGIAQQVASGLTEQLAAANAALESERVARKEAEARAGMETRLRTAAETRGPVVVPPMLPVEYEVDLRDRGIDGFLRTMTITPKLAH